MNLHVSISLLALLSYTALLVLVLRHARRGGRPSRLFSLYLLTMALIQTTFLMLSLAETVEAARLWYSLLIPLGAALAIIYFLFTRSLVGLGPSSRLVRASLLMWLAITVVGLANIWGLVYTSIHRDEATGLFVPEFGPLVPPLAALILLLIGLAVFTLLRDYRSTRSPHQRMRIQYLLVAMAVVVAGAAANAWPALRPYPVDVFANVLSACLISYAILRHHLLDINLVIRRGTAYFVPTVLLGASYFLIIYFATQLFHTLAGPRVLMVSLAVAILVAVVTRPLRDAIQGWIDKAFFREKHDYERMVHRIAQSAASTLDLKELAHMILNEVSRTMVIQWAALFLEGEPAGDFHLVAQHGLDAGLELRLSREHAIPRWLSGHEGAMTVDDLLELRAGEIRPGQEINALDRLGAEMLVPLKARGNMIGFFGFGPKRSGRVYTQAEGRLLTMLAHQTAAAVANARLHEQVQQELAQRQRAEQLLRTLNAASVAMQRALNHAEIFAAVAAEFKKLGFACAIFLTDERQERLLPTYLSYDPEAIRAAEELAGLTRAHLSAPITPDNKYGQVFLEHKTVFVEDVAEAWRQWLPDSLHHLSSHLPRLFDVAQSIAAPLVVEDHVIGVLSVQSNDLTADDRPAVTAFAHQLAAAWRRAELLQQAEQEIAERKRLEEQLRQAHKMEAVGRLAGGVAHDFNNLLTAINGFAELLKLQLSPNDPLQELVARILGSGQRAADLVRQLLAFSRKQIIHPRIVELNRVVVEMDRLLQRIIGEHIQIETHLAPDLWPIKVDPTQIEQVIINLAVNARDAMPNGGRLVIKTSNLVCDQADLPSGDDSGEPMAAPANECVLLTISDTGAGMNEEVRRHIFEPFFTTKEVGEGTGLGLATVYGIIKQSGGDIQVQSEEGQGTTFRIILPRAGQDVAPRPHPDRVYDLPRGTETVLLAEDEPAVRELATHVLRRQGYTILEADGGQEALRLAREHGGTIDLLLTDVVMPHMSGRELADQLQAAYPNLRILFTSGYTNEPIVQHEAGRPGLNFLQKPFSPAELARRVREVLNSQEKSL